ncbi:MAG TPA: HPF/RaiA family ribosome-associated protein [Candidatus Limnocylindrales bacterium]|nr:HPF/RaiA family ribosome-associated protein [Candidatus Limnocylindrales bacterium]
MNTSQLTRVEVTLRGSIPERAKSYAIEKISALMHLSPAPVLRARVRLTRTHHRAADQRVIAEASLDLNGRPVRVQVAAASSHEAIDLVRDRLRRKLSQLGQHPAGLGGRTRYHKPAYLSVSPGEREVLRHKAYQPAVATPEEAAFDMELMDYDFQLFTDAVSGWDAVVYRRHDGYEVSYLPDQPTLTLRAAVDALDATDLAHLFYRDAGSDRGNVLYRRHDGNYGLITPAK